MVRPPRLARAVYVSWRRCLSRTTLPGVSRPRLQVPRRKRRRASIRRLEYLLLAWLPSRVLRALTSNPAPALGVGAGLEVRTVPKIVTERFLMGEVLGQRLIFDAGERVTLEAAARIAEQARALNVDEDSDTLLAEIEHGCRELVEDAKGFRVDVDS